MDLSEIPSADLLAELRRRDVLDDPGLPEVEWCGELSPPAHMEGSTSSRHPCRKRSGHDASVAEELVREHRAKAVLRWMD